MSNRKIIPFDQKKKGIKVAVSIVAAMFLVVLYCAIFQFSGQEGEESGQLSHKVTKAIIEEVNDIGHKNWTDEMKEALVAAWEHPVRKGAHFSEYALMGVLVYLIWMPWMKKGWKLYLLVILWVFVSASLDEWHQTFVSMRSGNFVDVCIDTSGGCFGLFLSVLVRGIWSLIHGRKSKRR